MVPTKMISLEQIEETDVAALAEVGVHVGGDERSGTMILRDFYPLCVMSENEGLELMPIADALEKYSWLREKYFWKAVPEDLDDITVQCASQEKPQGYFLRVRKGVKVTLPCQTALYMASENIAQMIHNVVILEEHSELQLITGCVTQHSVYSGMHLSVDEQYIGKNARLINTMVHSWGSEVIVYPRTGTIVESGGRYESNYISMKSPKSISSNPKTILNGKEASAKFFTVIVGHSGSNIDIGGDVHLNADNTTAELVHRGICTGGEIYQRGLLIGNAYCKAHVDCAGILLNSGENGFIESIPGIKACHPDAKISHEASIGKIAPEQVEYLQSRGMDEKEAISSLIRGFIGADIKGLGKELEARIAEIAELAGHGEN
jgi:Fe-S cluster assembly scaffold protein SufB